MSNPHPSPTHDRASYKVGEQLGEGGFAMVSRATRRSDDRRVALKESKLGPHNKDPRMRREIELLRRLDDHPAVMPILDWDDVNYSWYVMPVAVTTLADAAPLDDTELHEMLLSVVSALEAAERIDQPHRDVTPNNILKLGGEEPRWVLGDWGMTRRPRGETTQLRTVAGSNFGTLGYVAPEVYSSPHDATVLADIFAIGRVIEYAKTGRHPAPGAALNVEPPWRTLARRCLSPSPSRRPRPTEVLAELGRLVAAGPALGLAELLRIANQEDASQEEANRALMMALERADHDQLLDDVAPLHRWVGAFATERPEAAIELVRAMVEAMESFGRRNFDYANVPLKFNHRVVVAMLASGDRDLFETACEDTFPLEAYWDRYRQKDITRAWLARLTGDDAHLAAEQLRLHPDMAKYLGEVPTADRAIREALASHEERARD